MRWPGPDCSVGGGGIEPLGYKLNMDGPSLLLAPKSQQWLQFFICEMGSYTYPTSWEYGGSGIE